MTEGKTITDVMHSKERKQKRNEIASSMSNKEKHIPLATAPYFCSHRRYTIRKECLVQSRRTKWAGRMGRTTAFKESNG
jgi:hypothetical protein